MKKLILTIIISLVLSSAYTVHAQTVSAADLWYPGDIGTTWDYEIQVEPFVGVEVQSTLSETRYYGGKEYKVIRDTWPGIFANPFNPDPDPFAVFREDSKGRILGYGEVWNEGYEEYLREDLVDFGARNINFQWTSGNEWTLLNESPRTGQRWTSWDVRISFTYLGVSFNERIWTEGYISRKQRLNLKAGEFDAFVVDYIRHDELNGAPLFPPYIVETLWLAPNVGMAQLAGYDDDDQAVIIAKLIKYEKVTPPPPNKAPVVEILSPIAGDILSGEHEIKWSATDPDPGDEIESLNIQYSKGTGPWINIPFDGVNDGSLMWDTTTVPDGSYRIRIIASDGTEETEEPSLSESPREFVIDNTPPSKALDLVATPRPMEWSAQGKITVRWTPAADAGTGLDGYSIVWDTLPDTVPEPVKNVEDIVTTASSMELASGDNYYFHIRAVDNKGNWGETATLGPFYIDKTPPGEVTELSSPSEIEVFSSDDTVDVNWTAADDWGSGLKGYSVVWDANADTLPDETQDIDGTVTELSSEPLSEGVDHYFHIRSVDKVGNWSATAVHIGPFRIDATPPTLVSNLTSPSHKLEEWSLNPVVQVTWTAATDTGSGLGGYSALWDTSSDTTPEATINLAADVTEAESQTLADGSSHWFHIRSVDKAGKWSDAAAHIGPFWIDTIPPTLVNNLSSIPGPGEWSSNPVVQVAWEPAADPGSGLKGYSVVWDTNADTLPDETQDIDGTVTELSSEPLPEGADYYFHIRSVDNTGKWSEAAAHTGPFMIDITPPTLVSNLTSPTHNPGEWSSVPVVQLAWESATDALSGLKGYSVVWDASPDTIPDDTVEVGPEVTAYMSENLADGNTHYFHIRSIDSAGNASGEAVHTGAFYIDTTGPGLVTELSSPSHQVGVWSNDDTVDVVWVSAVDQHSGLDGYSVSYDGTVPDEVKDMEEDAVSLTSPSLTDGTSFSIHIRGVDNLGNWGEAAILGPFLIDTIKPPEVTDLKSTTHTVDEWSPVQVAKVTWTSAQDGESGLDGYSFIWDTSSDTMPEATINLGADATESESQQLADGDSHYLHIRSADKAGNWSDTATHLGPFQIDVTPPTLVSNLTSPTHNPGEWSSVPVVQLAWESATDALSGLKGYSVVWDASPDTIPDDTVEVGPEVTAYTSENLADGNTHYFHIRSIDSAGNASEEAVQTGAFCIDTTGPGLVTELSSPSHQVGVWSNDDTVDVVWVSAVDQHSGLDGYSVSYDDTVPDDVKDIEEDTVALTSPNLTDGTSFSFRIRGVDNLGNWGEAAILGPFLIDTIKPPEVTDLKSITHTVGEWSPAQVVKVTWASAQDGESGLDGYSVIWDTSPDTMPEAAMNLGADATESESQQLADGDSHYLHIRSADKAGNWSDAVTHFGPFYVDATAPTLALPVVEEAWSNENVVTVNTGAADEISGLKGYSVVWDETPDTEPDEVENVAASATITSPELVDGKWYLHAKALDNAGNWSATSHAGKWMIDTNNIQPPGDLASDTHVPEVWNENTVIEVRWTPAVDDLSGLSGYSIAWDNQPDTIPDTVKELEADAVSIVSPEMPDGDNIWFHIRAMDNAGNGDRGEVRLGPFYVDSSVPGPVANLTASTGKWTTDNVLKLKWEPAVDAGSGLDGYSFVLDSAAETMPPRTRSLSQDATDWTSAPLRDGTYYFHIRSVDKVNTWSDTAKHSGPFLIDTTPPTVPANLVSASHSLRAWSRQNTINVSWQGSSDGMSGVAGYSVSWDAMPDSSVDLDSTKTSAVSSRLGDGDNHYFNIKAVDEAGNWSSVASLGPFYVDSTPPASVRVQRLTQDSDINYTHLEGTDLYYSALGSAAFTVYVSGTDAGSGLKEALFPNCVCPGATVTGESSDPGYAYSYQYIIPQTASFDGRAIITVYDNAGNSSSASFNLFYDNTGPNKPLNLKCDGGAEWNKTGEVTVTWEGEGDAGSGVAGYCVEAGNKEPGIGSVSTTIPVEDGKAVTFYVRGLDNVGNWGEVASATIGVDTKSPDSVQGIIHTDSDANPGYDNDSQLEFSWQPAADNIGVDHYEIHLSVDDKEYELLESVGKESYTVSGEDGRGYKIKAIAVDPAGNKSEAAESEKILSDMTPPSFVVAMFPNPGFYSFMDIVIASSELLVGPPSLSVDLAGEKPVPLNEIAENVWVGNYTVEGSGTGTLIVSGADLAGNKVEDRSNKFSVESVLAGRPARIESADGVLTLNIPSDAFDKDTVVTITPVALNEKLALYVACEGSAGASPSQLAPALGTCELEPTGPGYVVSSDDAKLLSAVTLTMQYEDPSGVNKRHPDIYLWDNDASQWEYVDSLVDEETRSVSASVEKFGIFGLHRDIKAPQITYISPTDGAVLDTSLPEFVIGLSDNGSGVDFSSLSVLIDGQAVSASKRRETELAILALEQGLSEGEYTFSIVGEDLAGNSFASLRRSIHIPAWAVIPYSNQLLQNYPNPFNPETWIPYKLSESAYVRLNIYNISGRLIRTLELGIQKPGTYTDKERAIYWDGRNENGEPVSSGVYFYHLSAGNFAAMKKMTVCR